MPEHTTRKPGGYIVITNEFGPPVEMDTQSCPHCGGHFVIVAGSGTKRGWCYPCGKVTCGAEACDRCVPTEKMLEAIERQHARQAGLLGY